MAARPLIVMFIGGPGSGKTHFGKRLAEELGAVRLNSDSMRLAIFGSLEEISKVYHSKNRRRVNSYVFGALDYVTTQLLAQGQSVVYEAVQSRRQDRAGIEKIAAQTKALPVLVHIKTSPEVAISRVQSREVAADSRQFSAEKAREVIEHFVRTLEPPEADENVIEISGEVPFEEQYQEFQRQLEILVG